jgi:hypothetical protein
MPVALDHRLEPSDAERLEGETSGLSRAKAASSDEMELGVCAEQPERCHVDLKAGNESIGNLLERGRGVRAGNGGDRLQESLVPRFALLEEPSGANLVGQVDRERDDDGAPAVGVDAVEGSAPPAGLLLEAVVTELRQVTRCSGRGHLLEE